MEKVGMVNGVIVSEGSDTGGAINFNSSIIPPVMTVKTLNDYNPDGLKDTNYICFASTKSSGTNITGLQAPSPAKNQVIFVTNIGEKGITFKPNSGLSLAENRFNLTNNVTISGGDMVILIYDSYESRWKIKI